jgi:hypothetical protein
MTIKFWYLNWWHNRLVPPDPWLQTDEINLKIWDKK